MLKNVGCKLLELQYASDVVINSEVISTIHMCIRNTAICKTARCVTVLLICALIRRSNCLITAQLGRNMWGIVVMTQPRGEICLDLKKAFLQGGRMPLVGHFKMAACSNRKQCLPMAVPWWGRFLKGGGF